MLQHSSSVTRPDIRLILEDILQKRQRNSLRSVSLFHQHIHDFLVLWRLLDHGSAFPEVVPTSQDVFPDRITTSIVLLLGETLSVPAQRKQCALPGGVHRIGTLRRYRTEITLSRVRRIPESSIWELSRHSNFAGRAILSQVGQEVDQTGVGGTH